jgi:GTPase SAR1 family protein
LEVRGNEDVGKTSLLHNLSTVTAARNQAEPSPENLHHTTSSSYNAQVESPLLHSIAKVTAPGDVSASTFSSTYIVSPDGMVEQVTEEEILKGLHHSSCIAAKAASIYN